MPLNSCTGYYYDHFLFNEKEPLLIVKADRRSGKTQLLCSIAVDLVSTHKKNVHMVCASKREARKCAQTVMMRLHLSSSAVPLQADGIITVVKQNGSENKNTVSFSTRVTTTTTGNEDDEEVLLVDDMELMEPAHVFEELVPCIMLAKKKILLIGTPTGNPNNILARLCNMEYVCKETNQKTAVFENVLDATTTPP